MAINGVEVVQIKTIPDERGCVLKLATPSFTVLDVYVTTVRHGAIKAWHGYETKQLFYTVVSGMVKLVLYDSRPTSPTYNDFDELFLGDEFRYSVEIPSGVYGGFKGISQRDAIITVQASEPYKQIYRIPWNELEYDWKIKNG